jgi:hypothetical protein
MIGLLNTTHSIMQNGQVGRAGMPQLVDRVASLNGYYRVNPSAFPVGVPDFAMTSGICLGGCHGTMPDAGALRPMTPTEEMVLDVAIIAATLPIGGEAFAGIKAGRIALGADRVFWVGESGRLAAIASGGRLMQPSRAALRAAAAGDWTLMRAEAAEFARGATGAVRVYFGDGKGRIFLGDELPELLKSLETGQVTLIEIIF